MIMLNVNVIHSAFGKGTVIEFDHNYITVKFTAKISKFAYPDAFEKYIKAEDSDIQVALLKEIAVARAEEQERCQTKFTDRKTEDVRKSIEKQTAPSTKIRNILDGFGEDYNVAHLARNPILTYQEVEAQFNIRIAGFGRGINKTPSTVVLI